MNRFLIPVVIIIVMVAGYLAINTRQQDTTPVQVQIELPPQVKQEQQPVKPPEPKFVVPEPQVQAEPAKPLPVLDESDQVVEQEFNGLVNGDTQLAQMLMFKAFIRNFVVIVGNMTSSKIPLKYQFVHAPAGTFQIKSDTPETRFIDPQNYSRYLPLVRLVAALDVDNLVSVYVYLYPLFQKAYEEMGYPNRYFNDRLVEVIEHLLETPEVPDPIALVQPKVYYQFADVDLEARSAGQKMLIRTGRENAALLKLKLKDLHAKLTSLQGLGKQ